MPDQPAENPEDAKLVTLARSVRARIHAAEGAAVRDGDGRTYAGATVELPSLRLSAVGVAVAMAVSSGSKGLESVVVVSGADFVTGEDLAVIRDFAGHDVPVVLRDERGTMVEHTIT